MATCANCGEELRPGWKYCIACGARTAVPLAAAMSRARLRDSDGTGAGVSWLAVLAFVLGCLLSPLAALFGHLAVAQIKTSGERGLVLAWVAVVLGYLWLVTLAVLVIVFISTNA
jgi:Domain of unknown function (DUF4190)/zinc-ribbon domain